MKINRLNIGEEVRKKVEERGMSKAKFAELLGIARQNIEKTVFQKHSLDTDLLCNISEVLNCNFFDYYKSDILCNKIDYTKTKEIKATLTIEMGAEKKEQILRFMFGNNNIEILNKNG
ncbi:helix-turn-helix domain-containing protein [Phocaeicola coprocola]|uniref:helix-turn-helix domain-containing protein n=1 Tax=Phocaeicola coprocola TaxID=310298 RepID=UPI003AEF2B36